MGLVATGAGRWAGGSREALPAAAYRCIIGKNICLWEDLSSHRGLVRKGVYGAGGRAVVRRILKVACGCLFCTAGAVFSRFRWHLDFRDVKMHFGKVHFDMGDVKGHLPWGPLGLPWAPPGPPLGFPSAPLGLPEPPLGLFWSSLALPLVLLSPP